jgi:phenylalanine-4-hydroxylase
MPTSARTPPSGDLTESLGEPLSEPLSHEPDLGERDPDYRRRRVEIAEVGRRYRRGEPIPDVNYTAEEDDVWRVVSAELTARHARLACREYLSAAARLDLPRERVPQLREVDQRLQALTGFRLEPVPGLVPTRTFYGALAERRFLATQYVRHHSVPFYTPEPDIIHEVIGHANMLASPVFADLYQRAGKASQRATTNEALELFSRVFWFSVEFGVVSEDGELRAFGAGILSSFGEIERFRAADIQPVDVPRMAKTHYDITRYQPILFAAASFNEMVEVVGGFFDRYDDDEFARMGGNPA